MEVDPVFVPFAKTVSVPELLSSCPGSAWARPAWQARPACSRSCSGRAARPLRSQAEPGNEKAPGTKAVRVGTRKTPTTLGKNLPLKAPPLPELTADR
jgi:hypothetical protein